MPVNLARRPFVNTRPVRRLAAALWLLGGLLLVLNGWLYYESLFGIESKKEEVLRIEKESAEERKRIAQADAALAGLDLRQQNVEATYLNHRIAERTFPWSSLFEHLSEVLPREVRLYSLAPQVTDAKEVVSGGRRRRPSAVGTPDRVYLEMEGAAESDEALVALLDALFASPWFESPELPHESLQNGTIRFTLKVYYLPAGPQAPGPAVASGANAVMVNGSAAPAGEAPFAGAPPGAETAAGAGAGGASAVGVPPPVTAAGAAPDAGYTAAPVPGSAAAAARPLPPGSSRYSPPPAGIPSGDRSSIYPPGSVVGGRVVPGTPTSRPGAAPVPMSRVASSPGVPR